MASSEYIQYIPHQGFAESQRGLQKIVLSGQKVTPRTLAEATQEVIFSRLNKSYPGGKSVWGPFSKTVELQAPTGEVLFLRHNRFGDLPEARIGPVTSIEVHRRYHAEDYEIAQVSRGQYQFIERSWSRPDRIFKRPSQTPEQILTLLSLSHLHSPISYDMNVYLILLVFPELVFNPEYDPAR